MNAVQVAINRAVSFIPKEILEIVFIRRDYSHRGSPVSIEQIIKEEVFYKLVLPDCKFKNGVISLIPLGEARLIGYDPYAKTYYIPKELTGGRAILVALGIAYFNPYSVQNYTPSLSTCGNSTINFLNRDFQLALKGAATTTNTRVDLIGENTIIVYDSAMYPPQSILRAILEIDENMNWIRPTSVNVFCDLMEHAIKAYIYKHMVVKLDKSYLSGGQELGAVKDIIDRYADSEEDYKTLLREKMGKIFYLNDAANMTQDIRYRLGGRR